MRTFVPFEARISSQKLGRRRSKEPGLDKEPGVGPSWTDRFGIERRRGPEKLPDHTARNPTSKHGAGGWMDVLMVSAASGIPVREGSQGALILRTLCSGTPPGRQRERHAMPRHAPRCQGRQPLPLSDRAPGLWPPGEEATQGVSGGSIGQLEGCGWRDDPCHSNPGLTAPAVWLMRPVTALGDLIRGLLPMAAGAPQCCCAGVHALGASVSGRQ